MTHRRYRLRVRDGQLYSEGELDDVEFSTSDWSNANRGTFRTASTNNRATRTLAIGSYRYLLKTFLEDIFDDRGYKTFQSINRLIENGTDIHQLLGWRQLVLEGAVLFEVDS